MRGKKEPVSLVKDVNRFQRLFTDRQWEDQVDHEESCFHSRPIVYDGMTLR